MKTNNIFKLLKVAILCFVFYDYGIAQTLPFDTTNMVLWVKSTNCSYNTTTLAVDTIYDLSTNKFKLIPVNSNKALYDDSIKTLNYYPSLKFNGSTAYTFSGYSLPNKYSFFIVQKKNVSYTETFAGNGTAEGYLYSDDYHAFSGSYYQMGFTTPASKYYIESTVRNQNTINRFENKTPEGFSSSLNPNNSFTFRYLGGESGYQLNGEVIEAIIFKTNISDSLKNVIENYLQQKYAPSINLGTDITIPYGFCNDTIKAGDYFIKYKWNNSTIDTLSTLIVNKPGTYFIETEDVFGFKSKDTITVNYPSYSQLQNKIICAGDSSLYDLNIAGKYFFNWNNGVTTETITVKNSGNYYCTVTDTIGCSITTNTAVVMADLFNTIATLGPDTSMCAGNPIYLKRGLHPTLNYAWSTGASSSSITINTTGQYSVVVTNTNNCVLKDTINVTVVGQAPVANFSTTVGCKNNAVAFTNLSTAQSGNTITSTVWDFGDPLSASNTSTLSNPFHTFSDTGDYQVKLTINTNVGCGQLTINTIHIAPKPLVNFSSTTAYQNDSVVFTSNTNSFGYSITNYNWNFGDPMSGSFNTSSHLNPKHAFSQQQTYPVKLVVTNSVGCIDSVLKTIIVKPKPTTFDTTGLVLWVQSTNCSYNTTTLKVDTIYDLSTNKYKLLPLSSNKADYNDSVSLVNYYPSLKFNGSTSYTFPGYSLPNKYSFFIVQKKNNSSTETFAGNGTAEGYLYSDNYHAFSGAFYQMAFTTPLKYFIESSIRNQNAINRFENKLPEGSLTNLNATNPFIFRYLGGDAGYQLNGEIIEALVYKTNLSDSLRNVIENYFRQKYAPPVSLGADVIIPYGFCNYTIKADNRFSKYKWNNIVNDSLPTLTVNKSGTYFVEAEDVFGFKSRDTINITFPSFNQPQAKTICLGDSSLYDLNITGKYFFNWNIGITTETITVKNAGNYYCTITDTIGCSITTNTALVTTDFFKSIASLGPDTTICSGNAIYLKHGASSSLTYSWSTGVATSSIIVTTPGTYSVIVTNTNNCIAKDTINVLVSGQAPIANYSTTVGCKNNAVLFTDLSTVQSGTIATTVWNFGDPLSSSNTSTLSNPFHTFSDTGNYQVKLSITSNVGCGQFIIKTVHVAPKPVVNFTTAIACQNDSTIFSNSSTSQNYTPLVFNWNFGDIASGTSNLSSLQTPKHLFSNQQAYQVKLKTTNSAGCADSITKTINVKAQVTASFSNTPLCTNIPVVFQDNSIVPIPNYQHIRIWNFGAGSVSGLSATKVYTAPGTYSVMLTVNGFNGCVSSIIKQFTVTAPPVASFTVPNSCLNDGIAITNLSSTTSGTITTWDWKLNNTTFSTIQSPTISTSTAGAYSLSLMVINSNGCKDSILKTTTVFPLPVVDFTTTPSPYCYVNSPITFVPTFTNGSSYNWTINTATYTAMSPSIVATTSGQYTVNLNLKDAQGCSASKTKYIPISDYSLDLAIIAIRPTLNSTNFMELEADLANLGTIPISNFDISYQISNAGSAMENYNGVLGPNAFMTYQFNSKLLANKGDLNDRVCVNLDKINTLFNDDNVSNNQLCVALNTSKITVYEPFPNPSSAEVTVPIILNKDADISYEIMNSIGQLVAEETIQKGVEGLNFILLPTSKFNRGCYVVKFTINDKIFIKRIIKTNGEY